VKARLCTQLAAALLLAPAATFLAQPAAAQQRAHVAPTIQSISVNADDGLSPGSTLRLQVTAAPRARKVEVVLGRSGIVVPLQERAPGSYTGQYVVRRADRIDPTQLISARVTPAAGGQTIARSFSYPPGFQALAMGAGEANADRDRDRDRYGDRDRDHYGDRDRDDDRGRERRHARDENVPQITELTPANGERVGERGRTRIGARLADVGSGIDASRVTLRVAGRDVTADARISADEVNYRADLEPGRYTAEVRAYDRAGNMASKAWTFDVASAERGRDRDRDRDRDRGNDRVGGGPLPLQITSPANGALVDNSVTLQGRTVPFASVHVQVDSVANVGGLLGVTQPVLDRTVQADRNGNFSVAVAPSGFAIPGQRYDVRMTATDGDQRGEERITLQRRQG
jgi:hypothetical protein